MSSAIFEPSENFKCIERLLEVYADLDMYVDGYTIQVKDAKERFPWLDEDEYV